MKENINEQTSIGKFSSKDERSPEWKTIGVKVRLSELAILNRQLSRLNYNTLGDLVRI
jgi:predicted Ser/Thr protein kinase